MTLPRLNALLRHWEKCPPVHVTVASFAGVGDAKSGPTTPARAPLKPLTNADIVTMHNDDTRKLKWQRQPNGG